MSGHEQGWQRDRRDDAPYGQHPHSGSYQRRDDRHQATSNYRQNQQRNYQRGNYDRRDNRRDDRRDMRSLEEQFPRALVGRRELFEKAFTFTATSFHLPSVDVLFTGEPFEDAALQEHKTRLNATKSKLDDKEIQVWRGLTNFTNQTGDVVRDLRRVQNPELCTKAFAKMFEMLATQPLIDAARAAQEPVATVHVCEAPGAFIAATNHYLRQHAATSLDWRWLGLSLNPYYEGNDIGAMLDDDGFIMHTLKNWYFGRDDSGNIMCQDNIRGLWERAKQLGAPVRLVTGDGSIDCSSVPNEQESAVAALHFAEFVAALGMLEVGGSAVLKLFTLFEQETVCLLYLMGCLCDTLRVVKPATSTSANSETYVVLIGYKGCPPELLEKLLSFVNPDLPNKAMIPRSLISEEFMSELITCAGKFAEWQRTVLERNLQLDQQKSYHENDAIKHCRQEVSQEYMRRCGVEAIPIALRIVPWANVEGTAARLNSSAIVGADFGKSRRTRQGTLAERESEKESRRAYIDGGQKRRVSDAHDAEAADVDDRAQAAKRPKLEQLASDHGLQDLAAGSHGQPSASDQPVPSVSPSINFSEQARHMMDKMNHLPDSGLGASNQGIRQPIQVTQRPDRMGLGALPTMPVFNANARDSFGLPSVDCEPLFDEFDGLTAVTESWLINRDLSARSAPDAETLNKQGWIAILSAPLKQILLSKFCRETVVRNLQMSRSDSLAALACVLSAEQLDLLDARAFGSGTCLAEALALPSVFAAQLAHLDWLFGFVSSSSDEDTVRIFLDLSRHQPASNSSHISQSPISQFVSLLHSAKQFIGYGFQSASCPNVTYHQLQPDAEQDASCGLDSILQQIAANGKAHFAIVDAFLPDYRVVSTDRNSERLTRTQLISDVIIALSSLEQDGWLILRLGDSLSRATVGILYLLHNVFEAFQIVKPWSCAAWKSEKYAVCKGFVGSCPGFVHILRDVHAKLIHNPDTDLLSLAPMHEILNSGMFPLMMRANERIAHREVQATAKLEFMHKYPDAQGPDVSLLLAPIITAIKSGYKEPVAEAIESSVQHGNPLYSRFISGFKAASDNSDVATDDTNSATAVQEVPQESSSKESLPLGWEEKTSRSSGKVYYYHAESDKSVWERPS